MTRSPFIARRAADYETFRIAPQDTNRMAVIADVVAELAREAS